MKGCIEMNDSQQKSIEQLKIKNEKFIKEINDLLIKVKKEYQTSDDYENEFFELMNDMEKAYSHIPFLPFVNAYCIKKEYFGIPTMQCLIDDLYGTINEEYKILPDEYFKQTEKEITDKTSLLKNKLTVNVDLISELLDRIIACNSITKRLSGLDDKIVELEKQRNLIWYPVEFSKKKYYFNGSYIAPLCVTNPTQLTLPFHRQMLIKYEYLFKTKSQHMKMLKNIKGILNYINEYLPFAELIPLKNGNDINIVNEFNPKQLQMGSENNFDGNINIGNEGDIRDEDSNRK